MSARPRLAVVVGSPSPLLDALVREVAEVPGVAVAPVPGVLSAAIPPIVGNFVLGEGAGYSAVFDETSFRDAVGDLAFDLYAPPGDVEVLVDASAHNERFLEAVGYVFPDATVVHVITPPVVRWRAPRATIRAVRSWHAVHRRIRSAVRASATPPLPACRLPRVVVPVPSHATLAAAAGAVAAAMGVDGSGAPGRAPVSSSSARPATLLGRLAVRIVTAGARRPSGDRGGP